MLSIKYYADCWYRVEYYLKDELSLYFKAYKITKLNPEKLEDSKYDASPSIEGDIGWNGCMEFTQNEHYCGIDYAKQTYKLIQHIYEVADKLKFFDVY